MNIFVVSTSQLSYYPASCLFPVSSVILTVLSGLLGNYIFLVLMSMSVSCLPSDILSLKTGLSIMLPDSKRASLSSQNGIWPTIIWGSLMPYALIKSHIMVQAKPVGKRKYLFRDIYYNLSQLPHSWCFNAGWFFIWTGGSGVKNLPANAGEASSIPGSGRSPGGGHGNPFQYSCLESPMDRGAWQALVRGVTKNRMWLSD